MLDDDLIGILRCPVTRLPLRRATGPEKSAAGIPPEEEALVTRDGARLYRACDGFPSLLLPEANAEVSAG